MCMYRYLNVKKLRLLDVAHFMCYWSSNETSKRL